eukprot:428132_1
MGCCVASDIPKGSAEDQLHNSKINKMLSADQANQEYTHRILLLGPGDSGKTTILKQMRKIYPSTETLTTQIDDSFIVIVRERVMGYMKILCEQSLRLNIDIDENLHGMRGFFTQTLNAPYHTQFHPENCQKMKTLWNDPGIKLTLKRRNEYQIPDNVEYFMNERLDDIARDDYVVTWQDFLRIRMRTSGFVSEIFHKQITGDQHQFEFTDVGGQRSERAKWMNMMHDDVDIVLYLVAISEYDLFCFEDNETRRLDEALNLFETVLNNGLCHDKTVILFFNKYDLFEKKLEDQDSKTMRDIYPDDWPKDSDPRNADHVCKYIFRKFKKIYRKELPDSEHVPHYHCTTALDTKQIDVLMQDLEDDLLKGDLGDVGL